MKRKKSSSRTARDRAWKLMSEYVRLRDCLEQTGDPEWGFCVTCRRPIPRKGSHAGHFLPGRTDAVLWEEDAVHLQCPTCNTYQQGRWPDYYEFMVDRYGQERVDELMAKRHQPTFMTEEDYRRKARMYQQKIQQMEKEYA
jgi:5-methylcytosine-specific restriction endonuclease McrA